MAFENVKMQPIAAAYERYRELAEAAEAARAAVAWLKECRDCRYTLNPVFSVKIDQFDSAGGERNDLGKFSIKAGPIAELIERQLTESADAQIVAAANQLAAQAEDARVAFLTAAMDGIAGR